MRNCCDMPENTKNFGIRRQDCSSETERNEKGDMFGMDTELRKQNRSPNTDRRTGIKKYPKFKYWFRSVYESVIDRYYHVNI